MFSVPGNEGSFASAQIENKPFSVLWLVRVRLKYFPALKSAWVINPDQVGDNGLNDGSRDPVEDDHNVLAEAEE